MGLRLAVALRNALANAVETFIDSDVGAGTIKIYTGTQPTNPDTAIGAVTLLATFTLNDPAFGAASTGTITLSVAPALNTTGLAAGTAGWFRLADNSGDPVMDGTCSATGGGGQIELNTTTVSIGLNLQITAGTITMPLGV